ncbi:PREDICTED: uncharacterized protein LOC104799957 [Tarenaya hassleriana]|uniref:uncharacterized protein LOC104799957 n=1 Tax=Tarenaya hassleriana TaxID=28532 RepID=UPI00053C82E3|nr:PREDICTED: uncharacterized protein LOC104799957 [Tarenaya hassleriana]
MGSEQFPDVFTWVQNIPQITKWSSTSVSFRIFPSTSSFLSSHPSLDLLAQKNPNPKILTFSIVIRSTLPLYLWTSNQININPKSSNPFDEETIVSLMLNFIHDVLGYASNRTTSTIKIPKPSSCNDLKDIFNLVFLTLSFLVSVYETPTSLRDDCLSFLNDHLVTCRLRQPSISLMKLLGSNLEEQWMRSVNLAVTNWLVGLQATNGGSRRFASWPSFSYAVSTSGLWKVQLYCPLVAMEVERKSNPFVDSKLLFSLNFHQLEGVMQFNYKVAVREKWIDVVVKIDNIRYDVIRLVSERLMARKGAGEQEKHFPSRISLQLTPTLQTNIISVSVSKSSNNPGREFEVEKSIEGAFNPPNSIGLTIATREAARVSMTPWKFEQSVLGYTANLNWLLYDSSLGGREVFSSRPSKLSVMMNPRSWFKDRYARAYRSFTRRGGVIFAGDEYGECVVWKVGREALGKTMEWEIKGSIWLTYWPNTHKTFYHETRRLDFKEFLYLTIA